MTTTLAVHVSGTIKALEWTESALDDGRRKWVTTGEQITESHPSWPKAHQGFYLFHAMKSLPTLAATKDAAQERHNARILAAIQPDTQPVASEPVDKCANCGATGHRCYGSDDAGPDHMDWIGQSGGRECCHACFKHPATPSSAGMVSVEAAGWQRLAAQLANALNDAINAPKGVVPASAERFYDGNAGRVIDTAALRAIAGEAP